MTDDTGYILRFGIFIVCFVGFFVCKHAIEAAEAHQFNVRFNKYLTQNAERYGELVARLTADGHAPDLVHAVATMFFKSEFRNIEYRKGLSR